MGLFEIDFSFIGDGALCGERFNFRQLSALISCNSSTNYLRNITSIKILNLFSKMKLHFTLHKFFEDSASNGMAAY